jgi:hypothetical protein
VAAHLTGRTIRLAVVVALVASLALIVAPAKADDGPTDRADIFISKDTEFNPANGVRSGSGTASDPFVISGWNVSQMYVADTSKYLVIRDNVVTNALILNWNGPGVTLVHNQIGDLRVNQNVKRTGDATSGYMAHNVFGIVGQLRHFDGIFEHNVVKGSDDVFATITAPFNSQAVQFDGFNGSHFRDNEIYGWVEVRLHGHHHGSGYGDASHYHGSDHANHHDMADMDHSDRWHQVFVTGNEIHVDSGWALVYTDTAHSANDRTAASEDNEALNQKHVHHTRVYLHDNTLIGGGLYVDVFNADDENHLGTRRGLVDIRNNKISLTKSTTAMPWEQADGISVWQAKDVTLNIVGNTVAAEATEQSSALDDQFKSDTGVLLQAIRDADIFIRDNLVTSFFYGVRGSDMSKDVNWTIEGLKAESVTYPVYYDNSVKNQPKRHG